MTLFEEFNLRYPEFLNPPLTEPPTTPATPEQIQYWLDWAENFLCPNEWGTVFREAVMALAAVMLTSQMKSSLVGPATAGVMGPVTAASVGGESVSYGSFARSSTRFSDEWFLLYPPYGSYYLFLRDSTILGMVATRTGLRNDWPNENHC